MVWIDRLHNNSAIIHSSTQADLKLFIVINLLPQLIASSIKISTFELPPLARVIDAKLSWPGQVEKNGLETAIIYVAMISTKYRIDVLFYIPCRKHHKYRYT